MRTMSKFWPFKRKVGREEYPSLETSNLMRHADYELRRAGYFDTEGMYGDLLGHAVMDLVKLFASQGHSGMSASITLAAFVEVANFRPLSQITSDPEEWNEVGNGTWQSRRRSTTFSRDGGKTWYDIDDPTLNNGDVWVREPR